MGSWESGGDIHINENFRGCGLFRIKKRIRLDFDILRLSYQWTKWQMVADVVYNLMEEVRYQNI